MKDITNGVLLNLFTSMILTLLKEGDNYGYGLINGIKEFTQGELKWREAFIYPLLKGMETEEMITSYWKTDNDRPKKYYSILENGLQRLIRDKEDWEISQSIVKRIRDNSHYNPTTKFN